MSGPVLRVGFAGTPDFAVPSLSALAAADGVDVTAVWTQPDRPAGRGRKLAESPVKQRAFELGIAVEQPRTLRDEAALERLEDAQLDLLVVAAYGLLLPQRALDAPRLGCVNVHASLLPRWRGAAPIQRCIAAGDRVSGVCIMQMEAGLDTGPVWRAAQVELACDVTGGALHDTLAALGARALVDALPDIVNEDVSPRPQADFLSTYAPKLSKAEAAIDWSQPAAVIERRVRAFDPWPVCHTTLGGEPLRIWSAVQVADEAVAGVPGQVRCVGDALIVATGRGALKINELQLAGRRRQSAHAFVRGRDLDGVRLGK